MEQQAVFEKLLLLRYNESSVLCVFVILYFGFKITFCVRSFVHSLARVSGGKRGPFCCFFLEFYVHRLQYYRRDDYAQTTNSYKILSNLC